MLSRLSPQVKSIHRCFAFQREVQGLLRPFSILTQEKTPPQQAEKRPARATPSAPINFSKLTNSTSSPTLQKNIEEVWKTRPSSQSKSSPMEFPSFETELEMLRYCIEKRLIAKTFESYQKIVATTPNSLDVMDHLKVMDIFRTGRTNENNERLKFIFEHFEKSGFPIAPAVFELMISRVGRFDPNEGKKYFDKFVATHGPSSVSLNAYGSMILAYFRNGDAVKAQELAEEAKTLFQDIHDLKPVLMELSLEMNEEERALQYFKEYIKKEVGFLKIAKVYGWLANWYANHDRPDDAICVIEDLTQRGININQASYNVLCKVAIQRDQLDDAYDFLNRGMEMVNLDRFGTLPTDLIEAHLQRHQDLAGAMKVLKMYRSHALHIRELRYRPYYSVMRYLALNGKKAEDARIVFNMIPYNSRFRNPLAVKLMVDIYLYCNDAAAAKAFLENAYRFGFEENHETVNQDYIRRGYQPGTLENQSLVGGKNVMKGKDMETEMEVEADK
ncbi:hypothetical protein HMI54_006128 [Coelomomyces lativittatus]|nr:hypothetical protein HMI56_001744 [Coelomomyces lativittatus]KAJ1505247.1 hypothetical protein HMI54_006128 [Coelomomyces lativittatus]KAJ1507130.1 hypothetical protein HMI55_000887 [Coelomomyces lativittatus]